MNALRKIAPVNNSLIPIPKHVKVPTKIYSNEQVYSPKGPLRTLLLGVGMVPAWAAGFKINGEIINNFSEGFLNTVVSVGSISVVSMAVVFYQIVATGEIFSDFSKYKTLKANIKPIQEIYQLPVMEKENNSDSPKFLFKRGLGNEDVIVGNPKDIHIYFDTMLDNRLILCLNKQHTNEETLNWKEKVFIGNLDFNTYNIKNKSIWKNFIKKTNFNFSQPDSWVKLGMINRFNYHYQYTSNANIKVRYQVSRLSNGVCYSIIYVNISNNKFYFTIPTWWHYNSQWKVDIEDGVPWLIVHNSPYNSPKYRVNLSNTFPTVIKHNTEIWVDFTHKLDENEEKHMSERFLHNIKLKNRK